MTQITRRGLLGAAAVGSMALAACEGTAGQLYKGEIAFLHGVASGDPLADRIILWTRVTPLSGAGPVPVRWEILSPEGGGLISSGQTLAEEGSDFCVKVDVAGLQPGSACLYRFVALTSQGEIVSPMGKMRLPAASGEQPVKLAIVSCSNWQFGHFNVYRALSAEEDLDVIVHLGDYIYEYGIDGYGGETGAAMGRMHEPSGETLSLEDYRRRHAQYKTDPDLQAAHAAAAWICTWDDHESTNDAYRTGAENHNPEEGEGDWSARKMAAIQAYFEWMPVREPKPGQLSSAVWRSFRFGDVATLHALETRLTGRSESLSWSGALGGAGSPSEAVNRAMDLLATAADPARTMLGAEQEAWLDAELSQSVASGAAWQLLASQVIMAKVRLPDFTRTLTPAQLAAQDVPEVAGFIPFTALGLPWNLDAWDGYPAARERLYESVARAGARLINLAGDTHTAYANELHDGAAIRRGVEFGCTSVTSPGMGAYVKAVPDLGNQISDANPDVVWHDPFGNGFTLVTLTRSQAEASFRKVSGISDGKFDTGAVAHFRALALQDGVSALERI